MFVGSAVLVCALGVATPARPQSAAPAPGRADPSSSGAQTAPAPASPAQGADTADLRRELDQLKQQYEARIAALEQKVSELTAAITASGAAQPATAPGAQTQAQAGEPNAAQAGAPPSVPPQAEAAGGAPAPGTSPTPSPGEGGQPAATTPSPNAFAKVFNPDMAVIGNMLGVAGTNHIENSPPLDLAESEASFQAVVDPYARADFFLSFAPQGVEVEEGFITFTSLPGGLLLKAGKMRAQFGKANTMHTHTMPWVDRPLVTRNLVGGDEGISQSGFSVSKLIMNPVLFLEATGEVFGGSSDVFQGNERSHLTYNGRLRGYRDLTEGTNLDVGSSFAYGHTDVDPDATRRLFGVDATFRWRPLRRAIYRRFIGRTELIWDHERVPGPDTTSFGMYASGEYQFAQRWYLGGRYDQSDRSAVPDETDKGWAATLTFWPSEFSQIRGEYRRTRYAEDTTANELLFQFLFSIGAHGAHVF